MIIRNEEHKRKTVENLLGGSGKAHFKNIIETPEELYGKGRVFSFITLDYCILEGEGEYSDNGTPVMLHAGDTAFCPDGEGHSLKNTGSEPLVYLALVIYK